MKLITLDRLSMQLWFMLTVLGFILGIAGWVAWAS